MTSVAKIKRVLKNQGLVIVRNNRGYFYQITDAGGSRTIIFSKESYPDPFTAAFFGTLRLYNRDKMLNVLK